MINKINSNSAFKNSLTKEEFYKIRNQQRADSYKKQDKIEIFSIATGLGVGAFAKIANMKNPLTKGAYGYFATLFTLLGLSAVKSLGKNDEIDLGNKEKNEEYKRLEKENAEKNLKYIYAPLLATSALSTIATTIICFAKNIPNKIEKIKIAPLLTVMPTLLASMTILGIKAIKENKEQKTN